MPAAVLGRHLRLEVQLVLQVDRDRGLRRLKKVRDADERDVHAVERQPVDAGERGGPVAACGYRERVGVCQAKAAAS